MTTMTTMTTMTSTKTPRNLRPWTLARAAAREQWAWHHPQVVRGIPERILREMLGPEAERLMSAAARAQAATLRTGAAEVQS